MTGNVRFDRQKTRDNRMYYINESNNLQDSDEFHKLKDVFSKPIV